MFLLQVFPRKIVRSWRIRFAICGKEARVPALLPQEKIRKGLVSSNSNYDRNFPFSHLQCLLGQSSVFLQNHPLPPLLARQKIFKIQIPSPFELGTVEAQQPRGIDVPGGKTAKRPIYLEKFRLGALGAVLLGAPHAGGTEAAAERPYKGYQGIRHDQSVKDET